MKMIFFNIKLEWVKGLSEPFDFDLYLYDGLRNFRFFALVNGDVLDNKRLSQLEVALGKGALLQIKEEDIESLCMIPEVKKDFERFHFEKLQLVEKYYQRDAIKEELGEFKILSEVKSAVNSDNFMRLINRCVEELELFSFEVSEYQSSLIKILVNSLKLDTYINRGTVFLYFYAKRAGVKDDLLLLEICFAYMVKDIGLTQIPYEKRLLHDGEDKEYRKHSMYTYYVMKKSGVEFSKRFVKLLVDHHELIGGRGYPREKKGQAIHYGAQLISIVDQLFFYTYKTSGNSDLFHTMALIIDQKIVANLITDFSVELRSTLASLKS